MLLGQRATYIQITLDLSAQYKLSVFFKIRPFVIKGSLDCFKHNTYIGGHFAVILIS